MRFFLSLILFLPFFFAQPLSAQNIDSLSKAADSTQKILLQSAKNFQRLQDSIEKARLLRNQEQNGQSMNNFLQEMKEREEKEKRQTYFRIALGIVFLVALAIGFARRRKQK